MLEQESKETASKAFPDVFLFTDEEKRLLESLGFEQGIGKFVLYQTPQIGDTRLKVIIDLSRRPGGIKVWRKIVLYCVQSRIPIYLFEQMTMRQGLDMLEDALDWLGFDTDRASE